MTMPRFSAEASLYKTSGHYRTGRQAINLPTQMISATYINTPGFSAESALSTTGRGYREIVNALTDDSRRSVFMALINQSCVYSGTITVVENGVPSTADIYECTVTVDGGGGGGDGRPFEGGDGPGRPGRPDWPPRPTPERAREIRRCKARCEGTHTGEWLRCQVEKDPGICTSIADNVLSRCKTRCQEQPSHNLPVG